MERQKTTKKLLGARERSGKEREREKGDDDEEKKEV